MNKSALIGLAAAVVLCGCHRGTANSEGTRASAAGDTGGTPVTLVGCLVPGGSVSGTVGTSGNTAASGFTLIDVTTTATPSTPETSGTTGTGTSGTAGTPAASGTTPHAEVDTTIPRTYSLIAGKAQDDLQKYENSRVEVTGIAVASTDTGTGVPDVGAASTPAGTPPTDVERIRVNHVRQLDGNCNGTKKR